MSKTLENKGLEIPDEFPNLEYIILDVRKRLDREKITQKNPGYEKLLDAVIRTTLLKEKFGVLSPGQPNAEKAAWFEKIKEALSPNTSAKKWEIRSAQRHQWHEENRAGQTYQQSGLE